MIDNKIFKVFTFVLTTDYYLVHIFLYIIQNGIGFCPIHVFNYLVLALLIIRVRAFCEPGPLYKLQRSYSATSQYHTHTTKCTGALN